MRGIEFGFGLENFQPIDLTASRKPMGRSIDGIERAAARFRQYRETNLSRLADVVTRNVGHDTPREHHIPRHGHR